MKVWEVNVGDLTTLIPVKYSAYPEPSFKWYVHCRILTLWYQSVIQLNRVLYNTVAVVT